MTFTVAEVINEAARALNDASFTRWSMKELSDHLANGIREVETLAPEALGKTITIDLVAGTIQTLPATAVSLLSVHCNITRTSVDPVVRGPAVTTIDRHEFEAMIPGWEQASVLPHGALVSHIIADARDITRFHVAPGNNGSGAIEAVVAERITKPAPTTALTTIGTYEAITVQMDNKYRPAMIDYVLSRAQMKDIAVANASQAAIAYYQKFANAFGIKLQTARRTSVNTEPPRGET
jgi:hypothetical protein